MPLTTDPPPSGRSGRPRVFLSFAGQNRAQAVQLGEQLRAQGVSTFIDQHAVTSGNFVLAINRALEESDFFVLLWSRHCRDSGWVGTEWSAALSRDLGERRSFLFVLRLDDEPLPLILATRQYLDVRQDSAPAAEAARRLVAIWNEDRAVGLPVLPAPRPMTWNGPMIRTGATEDLPTVLLYIRNRDLRVTHLVRVPAAATGSELLDLVRAALALPNDISLVQGAAGIRFRYALRHAGRSIAVGRLNETGIGEHARIDLEVTVETVGPEGVGATCTYLDDEPVRRDGSASASLSDRTVRRHTHRAFAHLLPRRIDRGALAAASPADRGPQSRAGLR